MDATDQVRLARSTTAAALILAVLSMAATSAVRPTNSLRVATSSANGRTARPDAGVKADPSRRAAVKPTRPAPVAAPAPVAPASPPVPTVPPAPPGLHGALPVGKGMWIWHPNQTDGGDPAAIAARAEAVGLTHVYVWLGSSVSGFATGNFLNGFLPVAHAHGLRVYGWDFPYLDDADGDVNRAVSDILYTTPSGDRIDGFAADIELRSMGVNISPATATVYTTHLRQRVGPAYPLIAVVPRPSAALVDYPYNEVIGQFDAVAPMVYWLNRDPAADVSGALQSLARFQKPVMPIGQAYDGAEDGGPPGRPNRQALLRFTTAAEGSGASSVSLWSWQHADQQEWDALRDAPQFVLPAGAVVFSPAQYRAYQVLLTSLGFPAPATGVWDQASAKALADFQAAAHLPVTGVIDPLTRKLLLQPFRTPVKG